MNINLEEQYAWVDALLRFKYYEYSMDTNNADWNDPTLVQDEDTVEMVEEDDDEAQDSRLLARKRLRHYPLSDIDADIWQACAELDAEELDAEEMDAEEMDVVEEQLPIRCPNCHQGIPIAESLKHEMLCRRYIEPTSNSKPNDARYCAYCDIQFDNVYDYVCHDAHCLGYNWQATLEEGLYYENTSTNSDQADPMDLEFEVGNMEWN